MATPKKEKSFRKPKFMQGLTQDQIDTIDTHLLLDKPMTDLVKVLRDEWSVCLDIKADSLLTSIIRYKQNQITPRQAKIAMKVGSTENVAKLATLQVKMENALKPVDALEALIIKQLKRVEKMEQVEAKMPTLMDSQTKNMMLLHNMLKDMSVLQMQLGILRRVPKKDNQGTTKEEMDFVNNLKLNEVPREATINALEFLSSNGLLGDFEKDLDDAADQEEDEE